MLKASGKTVWLGGNIGTPLLPLVRQMKEEDFEELDFNVDEEDDEDDFCEEKVQAPEDDRRNLRNQSG